MLKFKECTTLDKKVAKFLKLWVPIKDIKKK